MCVCVCVCVCVREIPPVAGWVERLISLLIRETWVEWQVPLSRLSHQLHQDNIPSPHTQREK